MRAASFSMSTTAVRSVALEMLAIASSPSAIILTLTAWCQPRIVRFADDKSMLANALKNCPYGHRVKVCPAASGPSIRHPANAVSRKAIIFGQASRRARMTASQVPPTVARRARMAGVSSGIGTPNTA